MGYRIGIDIGITSTGYSVIENDEEGKPIRIIDLGSRIFDAAEKPKDGSSLAQDRRNAREARRRGRRKKHRIQRTKRLLEKYKIINKKQLIELYKNCNDKFSLYELRVMALDEKITNKDLSRILINFVKRRGYKSNGKLEENKESGKLLMATKENEELMKEKRYRTIGEMYLKDDKFKLKDKDGNFILDSNGKKILKVRNTVSNYKATVLRKSILNEIKIILNKQKEFNHFITEEFIKKYVEIFSSQRSFDDGPGKPSPYAGNQIEKMLGRCTFEKEEKRAAKATYTFEYFKLLQDINHIKIEKTEINDDGLKKRTKRELTTEERDKIKKLVQKKSNVSYDDIRKELDLETNERFNMLTYKNVLVLSKESNKEVEKDKKLKEFESYHKIRIALNKVEKDYINKLTKEELNHIGYALTVYKNDNKRINYLEENTRNLTNQAIKELLKLSFTKVGNLSIKAMEKIIPHLEEGLTYDKAVDKEYEDFRGNVNTKKKRKLSIKDLEQEISNPVVRRGISQAIKVLNAITLKYNPKYGKPDVVVIELAREMGKNFTERNKIKELQENNMKNNEKIKRKIIELGKIKPSGQDIVKYKLWEEQGGICIYSGKNIPIEKLFTEDVEVDHIIPYSMCFDDTYKNKVLVFSSEGRQKGNRIPFQYEKDLGRNLEKYELRVNNIIKNLKKRDRLLKENFTREDAKEWKNRNIQDTQYMCRLMYNLVKNNLDFSDNPNFKRKVWTVNGSVTAHIRKRLGIEKTRDTDIHHAIDATIIAITTQDMINKITKYYQYKDCKFMNSKKDEIYFPEPWLKFKKELDIRTNCKTKEKIIECLEKEQIYTYSNYDDVRPIFVSRMPRRKVTGTAHLETIRGLKKEKEKLMTITKTNLTNLKLKDGEIEGYLEKNKQDDKLLYNALKEQLIKYNGDAKQAFKDEFYKPRKDGSRGPLVKKVKIEANVTLGIELKNGKSFVGNGDCIRIDVFYIKGEGYYFIPIYVSDTVKDKLPNKACVSDKPYSKWKEMKNEDFLFSLYPNDLIYIKRVNKIKLNPNNKTDNSIEVNDLFAYYIKAGISSGTIAIRTHDNKYNQLSLGIKSLCEIKKYDVDVLGQYHEIKLPEKRMPFNIKNKKNKDIKIKYQ